MRKEDWIPIRTLTSIKESLFLKFSIVLMSIMRFVLWSSASREGQGGGAPVSIYRDVALAA